MPKFCLSFLLLTFFFHQINAQTKVIYHKSHSGKMSTFKTALKENDPGMQSSNFGLDPAMQRLMSKMSGRLDTLKYLSDTSCLMIIRFGYENKEVARDTIANTALCKRNELGIVKEELKNNYHFENPVDSVVYIGYDNVLYDHSKKQRSYQKKNSIIPFSGEGFPPIDTGLGFILAALLISAVSGAIHYKYHLSRRVSNS